MYMYDNRVRICDVRTLWLDYTKGHSGLDILVFCLDGFELASHQVKVPWMAIKKKVVPSIGLVFCQDRTRFQSIIMWVNKEKI